MAATQTIPIGFTTIGDAVWQRLVQASLLSQEQPTKTDAGVLL
jgi:hypothetical protein